MTIEKYTELALRTKKDKMELNDIELGLIGEFGELVDCVKKIKYHNHKDYENLKKEFGDFLWYFVVYCNMQKLNICRCEYEKKRDWITEIKYIHHVIDNLLSDRKVDVNGIFSSFISLIEYFEFNIDEILEKNIDKLKLRYLEKYNDYDSINRIEK